MKTKITKTPFKVHFIHDKFSNNKNQLLKHALHFIVQYMYYATYYVASLIGKIKSVNFYENISKYFNY